MIPYLDAVDLSALSPEIKDRCYGGVVLPALKALGDAGYTVEVSRSLVDLKFFWQQHAEHADLTKGPAFDADFHPEGEPAWGIFLVDADRNQVGTVWRRVVELRDRATLRGLTLKDALEGLHVFYHDPLDAPRRETCSVECEIAEDIKRGAVAYGGALWIHPDHRHKSLFASFSALSRIMSITSPAHWHYFVLLAEDKNRHLALDHFPCKYYARGVWHPNRQTHNWLCWATYNDAVGIALRDAR